MVVKDRVRKVARCAVCLEFGCGSEWFTFVNPLTGKQYFDKGDRGRPCWSFNGSFVFVCDDCRPNTCGLFECRFSRDDWY